MSENKPNSLFWENIEIKEFVYAAAQRLRFSNRWSKEEFCRYFDINVADFHRYLKGELMPPESLLVIITKELESLDGGGEKRGVVRLGEMLDRVISLENRVGVLEKELAEAREKQSG